MRTIILLAAIALVYFILRWQYRRNPKIFTKKFNYWGAILFGLGLLFFVATGKLHWVSALVAGLVAMLSKVGSLLRYLPMLSSIKSAFGASAGGGAESFSKLQSRYFKMQLNSVTGEIDGEILEGRYQGEMLSELTKEQLFLLLQECQQQDRESALLLASYLARYYRSDWQSMGGQSSNQQEKFVDESMTRHQALDVLGLEEPVVEEDIVKAHRTLIQKFHPDRGGSNYLAAKINAAKDFLLKK